MRLVCALGCLFVVLTAGAASATGTAAAPPLIGTNFSHFEITSCSQDDTGIVAYYSRTGIRRRVRAQLAAMRAAGIQTLRLLLWHQADTSDQRWGTVPSAGGTLSEPFRSNLVRYLDDVRRAGFERLTVSFGPMWTNSPFGQPRYVYDPTKLEENWSFIEDVRPLLIGHGPPSIRVDLINEAPPSDFTPAEQLPGLRRYVAELYSRYVDAYGNADVLVSVIAKGDPSRLRQLVEILRGTGRPLPRWFEIHPSYDGSAALDDLRAADATLTANGLAQPFVVGEEAYDDPRVAKAIAEFERTSLRPIDEVLEWPLTADLPCQNFSVSPPYRADAYITELTGRPAPPPTASPLSLPPVPTLRASVGPGRVVSLRTAAGTPVAELDSGPYNVVVDDRSTRESFHLTGPDVDRRTGLRFRGTVVWRIDIGGAVPYGTRYSYLSDRRRAKLRRSFRIS